MSAPKRPSDDQDPDYVSPGPTNAKQQKFYEENARANTANKIVAIVEREFSKDIDAKEKEVLEIQNRLNKALKTLHLLRYVVITDFYNRKQCQAPQSQSAEAKQNQIHPAIKRLIGKTPRRQRGLGLQEPGPSTSADFETVQNSDKVRVKTEPEEIDVRLGQSSEEEKSSSPEPPKKIPRHVPPRSNIPNVASPSRGVRHKVRKRIVVGNISKWIPRDWREDGASHKWMMYVRGSKDDPDIAEFVSKVRFFLHPSYQPNDIVQVTSPPFHLSRRGWGEFPLRVQLHFRNAFNKPMDIIHHLKLDRTYTGLQTLGSETVVDIWIHTTTPPTFRKNLDSEIIGASDNNGDIDLSIVKKERECLGGSDMLVSPSNDLQNPVKAETEERRNSVDDSLQVFNEHCIKIEHNYVSNTREGEESTRVVHEMENNVTIRHSPPVKNEIPIKNSQEAGSSGVEAKSLDATEKKIENVATSNGRDNRENIEAIKINLVNNVQNGDSALPVPIKLVKCNDRFYFMTDVGKLSNNQVDFVKIANSDVVKNILAKRIQPAKLSITVQKPSQSNSEGLELSNGQNGAKLEFITKLSQNNSQQLEMQKLATSLRSVPSKSEPLKITIPSPFEPTRKKQILVLKNNKIISMNAGNSRQLATRSILYEKNQDAATDNKNRIFLSAAGAKPAEGTSLLKPSISILKKPTLNNIVKAERGKPATVLKINPSNSLLLNSNSVIPALQIATPLPQNCDLNKRNMMVQNRAGQMKLKRLPKSVKIDGNDDFKRPKVSVTLGKDKQKILSKKDEYEDVIRSIETVEINDTVGTLRFIMKRIPLITEKARDTEYKQMHPYACCTEEEFINYHLGKQRAHEWYRAKTVRSLLRKKGFVDDKLWSIKEILYWGRMHGYTPIHSSLVLSNSAKSSKKLPDSIGQVSISTCTESLKFNEWLENCKGNCDDGSDIEVDVVHIANPKLKTEIKSEPIDLPRDKITLEIPPSLRLPCAFVNETAREIGVKLQKEEIVPGVLDSTAERIIVQAMQSLVDDLMRRSLSKAWERNSNKCPDTIILDDVRGAILSREEFDVFTNEGLRSLQNNG